MKLTQFKTKSSNEPRVGLLRGEVIVDVTDFAPTVLAAITGGSSVLNRIKDATAKTAYALDAVEYLPAITPPKMLAIGQNYLDHVKEQNGEVPEEPMIFSKLPGSLNAHNSPIILPPHAHQVDYEAELAVIIGRRAKHVSEADAMDYVFGYAPFNDVSARDLQFKDKQFIRGKGQDTFAPIGPFITTKDEIADPHNLKIACHLNGNVMQDSNTLNLIFKIPTLISYITQGITLEPGDVIATGTPPGVGIFRKPPIVLKDGDVVEIIIEGLGTLRNPVKAEEQAR